MKGLFMILQYYFNWQFVTRWSGTTGFLLFILSVVLFFITQNNTDIPLLRNVSVLSPYVVLLLAYLCLLIIPLISSPIAFRALISNRQLGLIPGFRFKAGLALLMLTLLTSFFIFLFNSILNGFSTQRLPLLYFSLNLFCLCSVFIMAFQFALTSRYFVFQVSLGFMFVILLLYLFDRYLLALLNQPIYIYFSTLFQVWICPGSQSLISEPCTARREPCFLVYPTACRINSKALSIYAYFHHLSVPSSCFI